MILTIENINSLSTNIQNYVIAVYSIAMLCEFVTACIYMLNMKQLSASETLINHPLRRTRAIIILSCCVMLMLWRALVIIRITYQKNIEENNITECVLSVVTLLVTIVYYFHFLTLYVTMLFLMVYGLGAANKRWQFYCIAYICPVILVLLIILVGYLIHQNDFSWNSILSVENKWIVVAIQCIIIVLGISICAYVFQMRLKIFKECGFDLKTKIKRLQESKKLVNGFILGIILLILIILDVIYSCHEDWQVIVWLFPSFHALLSIHLLLRETILYDKDFQKPFRAQRQREAAKESQFIRTLVSSPTTTQLKKVTVEETNHELEI